MAKFDSREYEWADLTLILGGRDITGIRAIKYKTSIERELLYAKGRYPKSIQSGNIKYEGEIKMLRSEYEALVLAGRGTVLSLSLDCSFTYGNPSEGNALKTTRASGIRFLEEEVSDEQGSKFQEITLPFICLRIKNNA
ncbi:hypothetical protein FHR24_001498 [Wenyingzhuangia heitensis]|uniref:Uncharacterized protein n=1 Tax=Wenyingzhuangia heitensis TaxID=1487859 RepID=A0ABX0U889_9FLAO|nr:hypothetical protein [Wenyingzhuangia heitensis]NIJ45059.1 hypothetical protein [Wenyingzhuangia heitensis]